MGVAHIMWHRALGPDTVSNGICLCSVHHKLFDLGASTFRDDFTLTISAAVIGYLCSTVLGQYEDKTHVKWHVREVFKGYG